MKKIYFLTFIAVLLTAGCNPTNQTETVDLNAVNTTITQLLETYQNAWNAKDVDAITALVADDGLYCGSDPSELMDKAGLAKMFEELFADTTTDYSYDIGIRKIKLAADGKSAIVVEHITIGDWSPIIQMHQTFQMIEIGSKWEIDFIGWGFIAKNEDVEKLNKALE